LFCGWSHRSDCRCSVCGIMDVGHIIRRKRKYRGKRKRHSQKEGFEAMKKPVVGMNGKPIVPVSVSDFSLSFPSTWEYLTAEQYECGTPRVTATLLFFLDQGTLKCCVSDRENQRVCFITAGTMEELWNAVESALAQDTADWRMKGSRQSPGQQTPF